jgi:SAM-dependent methyltransferase
MPDPQWQFVGSVPENYERYLVPSIFAPWAHDLIEAAALQPRERVLDIACGTGIVARTAARILGVGVTVVGLDLSAPMLAVARTAAEAEGLFIEWREGSAVKLPLASATFDVSFCQQGVQFFPDKAAALSEAYRTLAPGGRLVLSVWREIVNSPGFVVLVDALTRHISREAGALMTSGPFGLSNPDELRALITGAGFRDKVPLRVQGDKQELKLTGGSTDLADRRGSGWHGRSHTLREHKHSTDVESRMDVPGVRHRVSERPN